MAEAVTRPGAASVDAFLAAVPDQGRRADGQALAALMARATGEPPVMWGASIVGFGRLHYRYASGREGETMRVGFAPRARDLVIYGCAGALDRAGGAAALGKLRQGKGCIYIQRLADVDAGVLEAVVADGYAAPSVTG